MPSPKPDSVEFVHPDKLEDWHARIIVQVMRFVDSGTPQSWYRWYYYTYINDPLHVSNFIKLRLQQFNDAFALTRLRGKK